METQTEIIKKLNEMELKMEKAMLYSNTEYRYYEGYAKALRFVLELNT